VSDQGDKRMNKREDEEPRWLRAGVPHCRYCGKAITVGDDAFDVEQLRAARACVDHFAPF